MYNIHETEEKWQRRWKEDKLHEINLKDDSRPKYYNLVMFPYPSGDKLHIGHWYNFGPADSWGRYMRMKGFNVLEPIGFDSFGLPAENYAIKTGTPPAESIDTNCEYMRRQLRAIGTMYDWSKEVVTSDPRYYKWTQWVFLQLYKKDLAYKKKAPVNWCPSCQTVLANEQVQDGVCERCKSDVIQKDLKQWFFDIRSYAEELLDHSTLDWPTKTKLMQTNWIGRSEGINIAYEVDKIDDSITVYTTRPDTNFGATFIVVAPECDFVKNNFSSFEDKKAVQNYIDEAVKKTDIERIAEGRKKTGVFTGLYAKNKLNGRDMPIYVSDFVLAHVGTGCVVGVPGHDVRDFEFAQKMGIEIIRVVVGDDGDDTPITKPEQVQGESGTMINSDFLDGLPVMEAKEKIKDYIEKKGWGERVINYKLRNWLISRQRYWGAPIPIVYDPEGKAHPIPEKHLPWLLPTDVDFRPDGESPLTRSKEFFERTEKIFGEGWTPEVDTMDTFMCSSWYFLRYLSSHDDSQAFDKKIAQQWLPVDMYIGGPEHACMHLLYARFIHKVLMDDRKSEPFKRLVHQGLVTKDGAKMSKSKGNVVSPDDFVADYGSDVFRMYLMFMGPFEDGGDWNDQGITGISRFVERFWRVVTEPTEIQDKEEMKRLVHKTIARVTRDIEKLQFNTALAGLMEFVNDALKIGVDEEHQKIMIRLIAPLAPHLAEEGWEKLGGKKSVFHESFPQFDPALIEESTFELIVQVNGKVRGSVTVPKNITEEKAISTARELENVAKYFTDRDVKKEIYVPGKLVSFVVE